jgi:hypothetical protein
MHKFTIAKLILAFTFLPLCLNAQDERVSTLFGGDNEIRTSGYGAFEIKLSQLDGSFSGFLLGGRGGIIINNVFSVGGAGYALMPTKKIDCPIPGHEKEKNNFWTGGYGGLFFEYINSSNNLIHFTANTLIAAGAIGYANHNNYLDSFNNYQRHPASFVVVLEPGVTVELNVAKIFRMGLGVSYRYSPNFELKYKDTDDLGKDIEKDIVSNTAFNGITANLIFKFGNFSGN